MQRPASSRQSAKPRFPAWSEGDGLLSFVSWNWLRKDPPDSPPKEAPLEAPPPGTTQLAPSPAQREPTIYKSLALNSLMQQLEPGRKYTILDLGPACGENLTFWSQYPVKIFLPDFYQSLITNPALSAEGTVPDDSAINEVLPLKTDCRCDIILGWDLFNYLDPTQLGWLISLLRKVCHPGTILFVLISTLQKIPVEPTRFKIRDHESLVYENNTPTTKPCPRYQPRDVKLMMAGFDVLVSFLLRHGVHEYLFVCKE